MTTAVTTTRSRVTTDGFSFLYVWDNAAYGATAMDGRYAGAFGSDGLSGSAPQPTRREWSVEMWGGSHVEGSETPASYLRRPRGVGFTPKRVRSVSYVLLLNDILRIIGELRPSCAKAGIDEVLSSSVEGVIACKSAAELGANISPEKSLSAEPGGVIAIARARADATRRGSASDC